MKLKNIRTNRPSKKLDWVAAKYQVTKIIGSYACRLNTPLGIYNVFYISLLKRAPEDPLPSQQRDDVQPPAILEDGEEEWEVERILEVKETRRGQKALVKWTGYVIPTWEPLSSVQDTVALQRYEDGQVHREEPRLQRRIVTIEEDNDYRGGLRLRRRITTTEEEGKEGGIVTGWAR